jgi:hypothetical protein
VSLVKVSTADRIKASIHDDIENLITRCLDLSKRTPRFVDVKSDGMMTAIKGLRSAQQNVSKAIINSEA